MSETVCPVCFHHCRLKEGQLGRCRARKNCDGTSIPVNYGKVTAVALDPIEKKPLYHFMPGSMILSVGSFGCNMACPFCQNHSIAAVGEKDCGRLYSLSPEEACRLALDYRERGNVGLAFTYNEAMVGYEFVRDTARLVRQAGLVNVLVTNGMFSLPVLEQVLPYIDAMNIDLKAFRPEVYRRLGGDLMTVKDFIERSCRSCHVEITSLIVPGFNDSPEDMEEEAAWIASLDPAIPLHITRYFPRHRLREPATNVSLIMELCRIARSHLFHVHPGNI